MNGEPEPVFNMGDLESSGRAFKEEINASSNEMSTCPSHIRKPNRFYIVSSSSETSITRKSCANSNGGSYKPGLQRILQLVTFFYANIGGKRGARNAIRNDKS